MLPTGVSDCLRYDARSRQTSPLLRGSGNKPRCILNLPCARSAQVGRLAGILVVETVTVQALLHLFRSSPARRRAESETAEGTVSLLPKLPHINDRNAPSGPLALESWLLPWLIFYYPPFLPDCQVFF